MPDALNTPFAIPIGVKDQFTDVLKRFERQAQGSFREIAHAGKGAGETLKKGFEPLAKLAGVGGILGAGALAGAVEGMERLSRAGAELTRTSARLGIAAPVLRQFDSAAYLAGASAGSAASGLETLGQKLHDAAWGRDAQAIGVLKEFGIAVRDDNGYIRNAKDVMPELADKIAGLKDPYQQAALATALLGSAGRDLLPWLRQGREGIERLNRMVEQYKPSQHFLDESAKLQDAQRALELAADKFGQTLADKWMPSLRNALDGTRDWLDELRKSPGEMHKIELGAELLAGVLAGELALGFGKLAKAVIAANASILNTPLGKLLLGGYAVYQGGKFLLQHPLDALLPHSSPKAFENRSRELNAGDNRSFLERVLPSWLGGKPAPAEAGAAEKLPGGGTYVPLPPHPGASAPPPAGSEVTGAPEKLPGGGTYVPLPPHPGASAPPPAGSEVTGAADESIKHGVAFFMQKGFSREQATGVVARLAEESGGGARLDPNAVNPNSGAVGIGQWLGARKQAALATGGDLDKQLELVWREFQTSERGAFERIRQARTAREAATAMESFERAGNPSFTEKAANTAQSLFGQLFGVGSAHAAPMSMPHAGAGVPMAPAKAADEMLSMAGMDRVHDRGLLNSYLRTAGDKLDVGVEAWCAAYVNTALERQGIKGSGSDVATSFARWGEAVAADDKVKKGDVLVKMRGRRPGEVGGHVGMATGRVDPETGAIEMIQGNIGGRVATTFEDPDELTIRRARPGREMPAAPPVPPAAPAFGAAPEAQSEAGAGASSEHHVMVEFRGLPQGARVDHRGSGPAKFSLRVQHAMNSF